MKNKLPLIVWSGGVDSTANVISCFSNKIPFETIYIKLPNNEKQQKNELRARKRLTKKLTELFGNYLIKDTEIDFVGVLTANNKFTQPYVWATSMSYNVDFHNYSSLVFGYIKTDDFWHVRHDFETVIHASHKLLLADGEVPLIEYPLEWYNKTDVIAKYYKYDKNVIDVLDLTSYCDSGKAKPCGKCGKCIEFNKGKQEAK